MVILAVDPGRKKTGVAIGNSLTCDARALETVAGSLDEQVARIAKLCDEWDPKTIVVGLPDKKSARRAHDHCLRMAKAISGATGRQAEFIDEAYTTREAKSQGKRTSAGTDAEAARIIANDWLADAEVRYSDD